MTADNASSERRTEGSSASGFRILAARGRARSASPDERRHICRYALVHPAAVRAVWAVVSLSKCSLRLIATSMVVASVVLSGCGSSSSRSSTSSTAHTTLPAIAGDTFLRIFGLRERARIKVTYKGRADNATFILIVSRDGDRRAYYESCCNGGSFTVGSEKPIPGSVPPRGVSTRCDHVDTAPICYGIIERYFPVPDVGLEDLTSVLAEDAINHAARVHMLGTIARRAVVGRHAMCVTINGPEVTRRLADGSTESGGSVCIDELTGLVLSYQSPGTGKFSASSLVATRVGAPTPSDFRPPVAPSP